MRVCQALYRSGALTAGELARELGTTIASLATRLASLKARGLAIDVESADESDPSPRWRLTAAGAALVAPPARRAA
jgi:DNA-binding MarR family transcriptional regulator